MKAKLVIDGKEFPIEIQDPELQKLLMPQKKTGYERADKPNTYYYQDYNDNIDFEYDERDLYDVARYNNANYYSNKTVAENNIRADKLLRQLRRFAVEHRKKKIDWSDESQGKYYIYNVVNTKNLAVDCRITKFFNSIYFDSEETAQLAIETFHDELVWYFTEYKDSL